MVLKFFASLTGAGQDETLLFALFINDREGYLQQNGCQNIHFDDTVIDSYFQLIKLQMDDTIIMSTAKELLQKAIDHICDFCEKYKLKCYNLGEKVLYKWHPFTIVSYNGSFKELHVQACHAVFAIFRNCNLICL